VLLVDDEAMVRVGLRMVLSAEPDIEVVGEAADGEEAERAALATEPDVVLMDVRMPRVDGIEGARRVMAARPEARVVVLTTFGEDEYVAAALRAGVSGFLLKVSPPEQLVSAVRTVAAGGGLLDPSVTLRVIETFARAEPVGRTERSTTLDTLTERERDVLGLIARGMSNAEIAADLYLGEATVKTHVSNVLLKLGLRDRVQAVVAAYELGLVQPGESPLR
jgi:DNA-binding NarL/FixJ family response regulator